MTQVLATLSRATALMAELFPILLARFAIYAAFGLGLALYWGIAALLSLVVGKVWAVGATLIFGLALVGNFGIFWLAGDYLLYIVKAGYVAVLTEIIVRGRLPGTEGQFPYARQAVQDRFKEISALALVDKLIKGVVRSFNRTLENLSSWLPIPGIDSIVGVVNAIMRVAANSVDEAVLALVFARKEEDVWKVAKDGVLLYVQNWRPILTAAVALVAFDWLLTGVLALMMFLILGVPTVILLGAISSSFQFLGLIFPLIAIYTLRLALIEPLVVTTVVLTYLQAIKDQSVDPVWDDKLASLSSDFRDLKAKIA